MPKKKSLKWDQPGSTVYEARDRAFTKSWNAKIALGVLSDPKHKQSATRKGTTSRSKANWAIFSMQSNYAPSATEKGHKSRLKAQEELRKRRR
ncbi:MAG: hypothetical protein ABIJ57_09325 [Pseudomonadota bacterium]